MIHYLISYLVWIGVLISLLIFVPLSMITWVFLFPINRHFRVMHVISCLWAWSIVKINPYWSVKLIDREKAVQSRPCVFISNHQSMVDILVLFQLFVPFRWIAKAELFRVPLMGWSMKLTTYISLQRANRSSFARMYKEASESLKEKVPIMIFPEGTRTMTGELNSFKAGAFRIALNDKTSIQPIILDGSFDALPQKGLIMSGRQRIRVKVLDEIPYDKFPTYDANELATYFRNLYISEMEKFRTTS